MGWKNFAVMKDADLSVYVIVTILNDCDGCAIGVKYTTDVSEGGFDDLANLNVWVMHFASLLVCVYGTSVALVDRVVQSFCL